MMCLEERQVLGFAKVLPEPKVQRACGGKNMVLACWAAGVQGKGRYREVLVPETGRESLGK